MMRRAEHHQVRRRVVRRILVDVVDVRAARRAADDAAAAIALQYPRPHQPERLRRMLLTALRRPVFPLRIALAAHPARMGDPRALSAAILALWRGRALVRHEQNLTGRTMQHAFRAAAGPLALQPGIPACHRAVGPIGGSAGGRLRRRAATLDAGALAKPRDVHVPLGAVRRAKGASPAARLELPVAERRPRELHLAKGAAEDHRGQHQPL